MPSTMIDQSGDPPVTVIDSHLHLWDPRLLDYPWLAQVPRLRHSYLPADLSTATAGLGSGGFHLEAVVFVEAGRADTDADAEVDWVEQLAAGGPMLRAVVAHVPLERDAGARIAALRRHRLFTGVRRNLQDEADGFTTTDDVTAGVRLLG
ncbi:MULTISPECIES: amidohydrolase family protein [unclassified Micromonospora]|uniref:amidohydrolase family protein n=1 Tax=unclassified Micromonospora TaxID=2617518 RepID=UPI003A89F7D0